MKTRKKKPATFTSGRLQMNLPRPLYVADRLAGLMAAARAEQQEKIEITVTPHQLAILMRSFELLFRKHNSCDDGARTLAALETELTHAGTAWEEENIEGSILYSIVRGAPVYCQLLKIWKSKARDVSETYDFEDHAELRKFLKIARAAARSA